MFDDVLAQILQNFHFWAFSSILPFFKEMLMKFARIFTKSFRKISYQAVFFSKLSFIHRQYLRFLKYHGSKKNYISVILHTFIYEVALRHFSFSLRVAARETAPATRARDGLRRKSAASLLLFPSGTSCLVCRICFL